MNCCAPADVETAITLAREATGKPVIVYPNSGEGWDSRRRTWTGPSRFSPDHAVAWFEHSATILGGCCHVGPPDIAALSRALASKTEPTGEGR